ncbi:MAG: hypothetical protein MUC88_27310 [Planctomycetes bacterium]|nr:hypothetical protein [Planctomycetota bacterium]
MYKRKESSPSPQGNLPFARAEIWERLPEGTRKECVRVLVQIMNEVMRIESQGRSGDERQDSI